MSKAAAIWLTKIINKPLTKLKINGFKTKKNENLDHFL